MNGELQLSLLGKLQISRAGRPISGFISTKVQALLCYLAVTGRPHERQSLAALLWGDVPDAEARTSLRTALANLRKLVGDHLEISREMVSFNRESSYWLDVELFQANLAAAGLSLEQPEPAAETVSEETGAVLSQPLRQAVELYQGDFLEGFAVREALAFEEWLLAQRERLHQQAMHGLLRLAEEHTARGEYAAGLEYIGRLLSLEPWREEAHRQKMILLAKSGQRTAALAQYERCCHILAEELGVEPSLETQALYKRLRAAEAPRPHNLPPQTTPFIGREKERAQIAGYLETAGCRLLTLIGPGGIGKTRLALEAASENLHLFQDGVFFVPLVMINSMEGLIADMASALNYSLSGSLEPKVQLLNYLRSKALLLVLDNFEHLLVEAGLLVDILQAAPQVKLIATSRGRLNLQEEWVIELEGLAYPDPNGGAEPGEGVPEVATSEAYSALAFFARQAQRVQSNFSLAKENLADVIRLCQLVNGMPLGLELASTWLPMLSCGEIVAEIERDLDFLTSSLQNLPARHRSMRAVFESSWNLLTETERIILKRLSVFQGGFQREAAVEVTGASLTTLLGLLNKSLLRRDASGRYDMHDLIRQYAAEKLDQSPQEKEETEARHCAYYARFMQAQERLLRNPRQLDVVRQINAEFENVQAAFQRAVEREPVEIIGQFVWSLGFFYEAGSWFWEGIDVFSKALERLASRNDLQSERAGTTKQRVCAQILTQQGFYWLSLTRLEQAQAMLHESVSLLRQCDAPRDLGYALQYLGWMAGMRGDYTSAKTFSEESLTLLQASGEQVLAAFSLGVLGGVAASLGEYRQAERMLRESLSSARELDKVLLLSSLSSILLELENPVEARRLLEEGLAISREMEDRWGIALCLNRLGVILNRTKPEERLKAKQLQQESVALCREVGVSWELATSLDYLGQTCCALGEFAEARQYLSEALLLASQNKLDRIMIGVLVSLAALRLKSSEGGADRHKAQVEVLETVALVLAHPASQQQSRDQAAALLAELEADLPRPIIETAQERAKARGLDALAAQFRDASVA